MVASDSIQILLLHTATERPPLFTRGTMRFEGTVIALLGTCSIAQRPLGRMRSIQTEFFACRTQVHIALGIIVEVLLTKERGALGQVSDGDVGMDVLALHRHDVVGGAILGISRHLARPQFPTKTGAK